MEPSDQDLAPDECLPQYGDEQEPIAIIGLSLRFAQDATTPEAFWNMMCEGRSGMTEVPKERFNIDAYYHPDVDRLGSVGQCEHIHEAYNSPVNTAQLQRRTFLERGYWCLRCAILLDIPYRGSMHGPATSNTS